MTHGWLCRQTPPGLATSNCMPLSCCLPRAHPVACSHLHHPQAHPWKKNLNPHHPLQQPAHLPHLPLISQPPHSSRLRLGKRVLHLPPVKMQQVMQMQLLCQV